MPPPQNSERAPGAAEGIFYWGGQSLLGGPKVDILKKSAAKLGFGGVIHIKKSYLENYMFCLVTMATV